MSTKASLPPNYTIPKKRSSVDWNQGGGSSSSYENKHASSKHGSAKVPKNMDMNQSEAKSGNDVNNSVGF